MISKEQIEELIQQERADADEKHGKMFQTNHEAWAVLMEETDEVEEQINHINDRLQIMWSFIRKDNNIRTLAGQGYDHTISLIQEAIQVAAMFKKAIDSEEGRNGEYKYDICENCNYRKR